MTAKEALSKFDDPSVKKFDELDVRNELKKLNNDESKPIEPDLLAELMAFAFQENNPNQDKHGLYFGSMMTWKNSDGTLSEFPSVSKVTPEMIDYWTHRATEVKNPILAARYSGLVWDLQLISKGSKPSHEICRLNIKATLDLFNGNYCKHEIYCLKKLERALGLAISLNDQPLIDACKTAIILAEAKFSQDTKPGLWGYAFDLLINNKKVNLTTTEEQGIIQELENKLDRLTRDLNGQKIDPWAAEAAAERLAQYYRLKGRNEDSQRVILQVGKAFDAIESEGSAMQVAGWLDHLNKLYARHGLNTEANQVLARLEKIGPKVASELSTVSSSVKFPREKLEQYSKAILSGTPLEILKRIAVTYIPSREKAKDEIFDLSKKSPLLYLMQHQLQDAKGRAIATIGSLDDDLEGHIVRHVSQHLSFSSLFLRLIFDEASKQKSFDQGALTDFILRSPVIHRERHSIIQRGIKAFFERDYLVSIHLLVPQIEQAIRNLISSLGGVVTKVSRGGGQQLRTFDDLLRDPLVEEVFGVDLASYFRILFTDQRGWNVRNNVAHGISDPESFDVEVADRIIHALLCLGLIKEQPATQA